MVKNYATLSFSFLFLLASYYSGLAQNPDLPFSPDAVNLKKTGLPDQKNEARPVPPSVPVTPSILTKNAPNPKPFAVCSDLGGDNGWGSWSAQLGYHQYGVTYPSFFAGGAPTTPRFAITGAGSDPCTQAASGPVVPYVAPGFGSASIRIGEPNVNGINGGCTGTAPYPPAGLGASANGCSERLTNTFTVTSKDTNFVYAYSVILENPNGGHAANETPFAEIYMLDKNGDTVTCSHRKYSGDQNGGVGPGFYKAACTGSPGNGFDVTYIPWTLVGINLTKYIGQTLTIVITNSDCALGGHYCYSYWDFSCGVFSTNPASYCVGQSVSITAPTSPTINYTYHWSPGGQTTSSIVVKPQPGDTFHVALHQPSGCDFYLTYVPVPLGAFANFGFSTSCTGAVAFSDSSGSTTGTSITGWSWSFPGGSPSSSTSQNPSVTYPAGTYTATLIVSSQGGCKDTIRKIVTLPGPPKAVFSVGPGCPGSAIQFSDSSTSSGLDPIQSWSWNFPGGTPGSSTSQNPTVTYPVGNYTATLTVTTKGGCTSTISHPVTFVSPTAAFTVGPVCAGNITQFNDGSNASGSDPVQSWSWSFPGGSPGSSTSKNPAVTYPAGSYTASLTITTKGGCTSTVSKPVTVNPLPVANMSGTNVCQKNANSFTDLSVGNTTVAGWSWSFGDGGTSTSQNPSHTYTNPGTYPVTLTVTNTYGCVSSKTISVVVNPVPAANFSSVPVCIHNSTCFTNLSTIASGNITGWSWNFGDPSTGANDTSGQQSPCHTFSGLGPFTVTLTVTSDSGCVNTTKLPAVINPPPVANFTSSPVCLGSPTLFSDLSTATSPATVTGWSWDFGDGASFNQQNPSHTYAVGGTYTVTLIITSSQGCKDTISKPITVNPLPVANMTGTNVCFNNANSFSDLSAGNTTIASWSWNFGDNKTSTSQNPTHTYANPGTYPVTLTVTNTYGCVSSHTITVVVNPLPIASFSTAPVCIHENSCFKNLSTISTGNVTGWSWNFGDPSSGANNISNQQNPCHTFVGANTLSFTVILTVTSDSGCQSTTMLPATLNPPPVPNFTSTPVCLGSSTIFKDLSTAVSPATVTGWNWNFGDGTPGSTQQNPTHTYTAAGSYTATLIVTSSQGCKDTIPEPVTVYSLPTAAFTSPDSGCSPVCKTFQDLSQAGSGSVVNWQWSFPGGSPSTDAAKNGSACWKTPGSYGVQLIVTTNYGCKDTLYVPDYIKVFDWPKADFCLSPDQASIEDPTFSFCPLWSGDVTHWSWDFGDGDTLTGGAPANTNTHPVHSYSATANNNDWYNFEVCVNVQNAHGCYDKICHPVELLPEFTFYIPNCVTPNGDSINDFFFGKSRGVKDYNIWVFDRWGNLLWDCHHDGKNTDWDRTGQDGMSSACKWNARVVPGGLDMNGSSRVIGQEDVFVWKVRLTDIFNKVHSYIGHVSIVR